MLSDIDSITNIVTCITTCITAHVHVQVVKFLYSVSFSAS